MRQCVATASLFPHQGLDGDFFFLFLSALSSLTGCPSCVNSSVCVPLIGVCPFIWLIDRNRLLSGKCYSFAQSFSVNDSPNGQMQKIYFKLTFKYKEDLVLLKTYLCIESDWMKRLAVTFKRDKSDFFTPAVQHFHFQSVWRTNQQSSVEKGTVAMARVWLWQKTGSACELVNKGSPAVDAAMSVVSSELGNSFPY